MNLEDCQVRVTRTVLRRGPSVRSGDAVDVGDGRHVVEGAGVDVPGVVLLGGVFEGLELVAAGVGGEGFECWTGSRDEAGDAAGLAVDGELEVGVARVM